MGPRRRFIRARTLVFGHDVRSWADPLDRKGGSMIPSSGTKEPNRCLVGNLLEHERFVFTSDVGSWTDPVDSQDGSSFPSSAKKEPNRCLVGDPLEYERSVFTSDVGSWADPLDRFNREAPVPALETNQPNRCLVGDSLEHERSCSRRPTIYDSYGGARVGRHSGRVGCRASSASRSASNAANEMRRRSAGETPGWHAARLRRPLLLDGESYSNRGNICLQNISHYSNIFC